MMMEYDDMIPNKILTGSKNSFVRKTNQNIFKKTIISVNLMAYFTVEAQSHYRLFSRVVS